MDLAAWIRIWTCNKLGCNQWESAPICSEWHSISNSWKNKRVSAFNDSAPQVLTFSCLRLPPYSLPLNPQRVVSYPGRFRTNPHRMTLYSSRIQGVQGQASIVYTHVARDVFNDSPPAGLGGRLAWGCGLIPEPDQNGSKHVRLISSLYLLRAPEWLVNFSQKIVSWHPVVNSVIKHVRFF